MSGAYYNEFDAGAAAWLRELIRNGSIADGEVDERSILEVDAVDLVGFTQCHFFAGIGGWSYALRLADWPDDLPVWTGSPPCQPFSGAGRKLGRDDPRHLAPHFIGLVRAGRPRVLLGEQVASADVFGKAANGARKRIAQAPAWAWVDDLSDRLEAARYAVGASDFPSAGIGAPHIRQRTFFGAVRLADANGRERQWLTDGEGRQQHGTQARRIKSDSQPAAGRDVCGLADDASLGWLGRRAGQAGDEFGAQQRPNGLRHAGGLGDGQCAGLEGHGGHGDRGHEPGRVYANASGSVAPAGADGRMADTDGRDAGAEWQQCGGEQRQQPQDGGTGRMADASCKRRQQDARGTFADEKADGRAGRVEFGSDGDHVPSSHGEIYATRPTNGLWSDVDWLFCRDGKWRPVEPAIFGVADGIPRGMVPGGPFVPASFPLAQGGKDARRVMRLRGYGNAINPHAAAIFIQSFRAALSGIDEPGAAVSAQ